MLNEYGYMHKNAGLSRNTYSNIKKPSRKLKEVRSQYTSYDKRESRKLLSSSSSIDRYQYYRDFLNDFRKKKESSLSATRIPTFTVNIAPRKEKVKPKPQPNIVIINYKNYQKPTKKIPKVTNNKNPVIRREAPIIQNRPKQVTFVEEEKVGAYSKSIQSEPKRVNVEPEEVKSRNLDSRTVCTIKSEETYSAPTKTKTVKGGSYYDLHCHDEYSGKIHV